MERMKVMTMPRVVAPDQRQARLAARQEMVRHVEHGMTAREARKRCSVPMHRTTVYRLLKRVQSEGEDALAERRHGHPVKLRGEVLTFLLDYCQSYPSASSSAVQRRLAERFGLSVSVSQQEARASRSRPESHTSPTRKKSRKLASRLPRDIMNRLVDCC